MEEIALSPLLVLALAGLFSVMGGVVTLLITKRIVTQAANASISDGELATIKDLMDRLHHASSITKDSPIPYLDAVGRIVVETLGLKSKISINVKEGRAFVIKGELSEEDIRWLILLSAKTGFIYLPANAHKLTSKGLRRKNHFYLGVHADGNFRIWLFTRINHPVAKSRSLAAVLNMIFRDAEITRMAKAEVYHAAKVNDGLNQQIMNLWQILDGINHNFKGILTAPNTAVSTIAAKIQAGKDVSYEEMKYAFDVLAPVMPIIKSMVEVLGTSMVTFTTADRIEQAEVYNLEKLFTTNFSGWLSRQSQIKPEIKINIHDMSGYFVHVNKTAFFQIVWNLLQNAYKYTKSGEISITANEGIDGLIYLHIQDTGVGISQEDLDLVGSFRFRSSSAANLPGQGVGLWFTNKLLSMMGGNLVIESIEGEGSTFSAGFPKRGLNVCH
ncbi:hypothetical protein KQH40_00985 [bacterium]|nr:hypothetical protein [bacterium]